MIKFHPTQEMLTAHAAGDLDLSLAIGVSAHCHYCHDCQQALANMVKCNSAKAFVQSPATNTALAESDDLSAMIGAITALDADHSQPVIPPPEVTIKNQRYQLPKVFNQQLASQWQSLGKISRMRLPHQDNAARASLLHIQATGNIPPHTHKGVEITLLLAGEFCDDQGSYRPGDFIIKGPDDEHSPSSASGCLCYTVVNAPLHFTKGISKLFNPIGDLIY
ncbi:ChrR family anti-sigma-E factor [Shewanella sp. NIFS-20-20]|uniref:ChrR family anti-sigma-E factor n=1 Tax=Shewanella sp. NIFS-20-20 TaxID=2853806 RepID=UPI001C45E756|nr:ChrR family anti-sigma-E factor [Shewanella sp. NIFS-20-20]MBV7314321.1 ChrR family anti-sigma-E factor [Shewanella sp. NIFS-20-20]